VNEKEQIVWNIIVEMGTFEGPSEVYTFIPTFIRNKESITQNDVSCYLSRWKGRGLLVGNKEQLLEEHLFQNFWRVATPVEIAKAKCNQ
jgi:hypothetical protein